MASVFDVELDKARQSLRGIDDTIRTLTGRPPFDFPRGRGGFRGGGRGGFGPRPFFSPRVDYQGPPPPSMLGRRRISYREDAENDNYDVGFKRARRDMEAPEPYDNFGPKPMVASSVMMPPKETKSRDEAITELRETEKKQSQGAVRNRRMFGMLMGTLQRFRKDEKKDHYKEQEKKQREVEAKLEDEKRKEAEDMAAQREQLMVQRRDHQAQIRRLQRKRVLTLITDREIGHLQKLQQFIQTQAKPPIFYAPAKHTLRTVELQKKTERRIEELIVKKREQLESEMQMMEARAAAFRQGGGVETTQQPRGRPRGRSPKGSDEEDEEESDTALTDDEAEKATTAEEKTEKPLEEAKEAEEGVMEMAEEAKQVEEGVMEMAEEAKEVDEGVMEVAEEAKAIVEEAEPMEDDKQLEEEQKKPEEEDVGEDAL